MDLNEIKTFYDPHPGFAGAAIRISEEVRLVANELDGTSMSLHEAISKIQAVTNGSVEVVGEYGYISLLIEEATPIGQYRHFFRVIRYR